MARTRVAVLLGARQCLIAAGSKTTMVDIATTSGVAKATLYNHFRTKSEVFAALVEHEILTAARDTAELVESSGPQLALHRLAERVGEHPVVRRLAATEPAVLAALLLPGPAGLAGLGAGNWAAARTSLASVFGVEVDLECVLRYLVSLMLWPAERAEIERAVAGLLATSATAAGAAPVAVGAPPAADVASAGAAGAPEPAVVPGATVPGLGFPAADEMLEHVALG